MGTSSAANFAHELTHAAISDYNQLGRPGLPGFVEPFVSQSDNTGGLPSGAHEAMDLSSQMRFGNIDFP